ncbi:MAG TPA: hypothetical protein PK821_01925 [Victivallales bacterium]|nr:hypothetical protein [Victivallales bacterium]
MILFSILAIVMVLSIGVSYLVQGEFGEINVHLAAYGFILAGIGYVIELLTKREKDLDMKIAYMLNKKFVAFSEELKTIRAMLIKMEDRRIKSDDVKTETKEPASSPIVTERIEYKIPAKENN